MRMRTSIGSTSGRHQVHLLGLQHDASLIARARRQIVHAVEAAQEGALAAARGSDQRRDLLLADLHVQILERLELAIIETQRLGARLDGRLERSAAPRLVNATAAACRGRSDGSELRRYRCRKRAENRKSSSPMSCRWPSYPCSRHVPATVPERPQTRLQALGACNSLSISSILVWRTSLPCTR